MLEIRTCSARAEATSVGVAPGRTPDESSVAVHGVGRKRRHADCDVLTAVLAQRAVAGPFACRRVHGLPPRTSSAPSRVSPAAARATRPSTRRTRVSDPAPSVAVLTRERPARLVRGAAGDGSASRSAAHRGDVSADLPVLRLAGPARDVLRAVREVCGAAPASPQAQSPITCDLQRRLALYPVARRRTPPAVGMGPPRAVEGAMPTLDIRREAGSPAALAQPSPRRSTCALPDSRGPRWRAPPLHDEHRAPRWAAAADGVHAPTTIDGGFPNRLPTVGAATECHGRAGCGSPAAGRGKRQLLVEAVVVGYFRTKSAGRRVLPQSRCGDGACR